MSNSGWATSFRQCAQTLSIASSPATRHDYVLTATYSSGSYTLNLYQDGTASTPITSLTAGTTAWKINAILNGYSSSGYSFYGQFEYMYIWSGRVLASTDAATLSVIGGGNPYSILKPASSGGSGTPGGSSGQIQYDNAGSFGGFTMSGDATLVPSTGVITISPGAVTLAKQANFAASSLMGNPTGSSAAPSAITLGTNLSFSGSVLNATAGGGGISSVAMTVPSWLTVSGSPITTSGTLAVTATTGETANEFLATPNGSSGALAIRAIVAADLPTTGLTITQSAGSIIAATPGSTITFNLALGNVQSVTLGANSTLVFSGATVGQRFILNIQQAASGGPYSVTWPSTASSPYGTGITWMTPTYAAPAMPATASGVITLAFLCTGSGAYLGYYSGQSAS